MKSSYSTLMQSKFFSPAFNSAIFDGPVRIYFAQFHEGLALKVYFLAQQRLAKELAQAKDISKATGANILVMIYPTVDSFLMSFDGQNENDQVLAVEKWNEDIVIGTRGPLDEEHLETMIDTIRESILSWTPRNLSETALPGYISEAGL